ncbi:hypothetical protein [Nitrosovibrio sp. Nv17]|nr:hypothetical protein [Nitrosovibrio sp. Nv17]SFW29590.1 hypothetical protein SAMN05216414_1132 [Nitrosovibrio sp. Nv17]
MASEADEKELTFDIVFGLGGEFSSTALKLVQGALLDVFKDVLSYKR